MIAWIGTLVVLGAISWYFAVIDSERVPQGVSMFAGVLLAGIGGSVVGVVVQPGVVSVSAAVVSAAMGGFLLWLLTQRRLPDGKLVVGEGDPLPPLEALDENGLVWALDSLRGERVMLKLFRGSW